MGSFIQHFVYVFLAVLGLGCFARAFSRCALLTNLQCAGLACGVFSCCGAWAQGAWWIQSLQHGAWSAVVCGLSKCWLCSAGARA